MYSQNLFLPGLYEWGTRVKPSSNFYEHQEAIEGPWAGHQREKQEIGICPIFFLILNPWGIMFLYRHQLIPLPVTI